MVTPHPYLLLLFLLTHCRHVEGDYIPHRYPRKTGRGPALNTSECDNITGVPDAVRTEMNLDSFYKKYAQAYGIPIISSNNPPDAALRRACYTVLFLLADRQDLRDAMHDGHGRVGIIGLTERTTEIPEHSYLDATWDERARGLGATRRVPISTAAEENVLCYGAMQDRWFEEDVLVHEFSHGINLVAISQADPSWEGKLATAYENAKKKGLWQYTYAITTPLEYFAEGVQSYFDVEVHRTFVDFVHNNISTRGALLDYDPELYELIREVFPCENKIVNRCDNQTEIDWQPMKMDCPYVKPLTTTISAVTAPVGQTTDYGTSTASLPIATSRKITFLFTTATTGTTTATETDCEDDAPFCDEMATLNECTYSDVIRDMCQRSCRACSGCLDYMDLCPDLAGRDFCEHRKTYMFRNCGRSCEACR